MYVITQYPAQLFMNVFMTSSRTPRSHLLHGLWCCKKARIGFDDLLNILPDDFSESDCVPVPVPAPVPELVLAPVAPAPTPTLVPWLSK